MLLRPRGDAAYGVGRFVGGVLGRAVVAFAISALAVTLLPILLGWKPFVIRSGSMEPRISVGDVVLASPSHDPETLLHHVAVFADPGAPGQVKSHRVVSIDPAANGSGQVTLRTKGDANPTDDALPVPIDDVIGIGRLLVPGAGLPLVWLRSGQWWRLFALVVGLGLACWFVIRDDEVYADDDDEAWQGPRALRALSGWRLWPGRRAPRIVIIGLGAAALVLPTSSAAFSATTRSKTSTWTTATARYDNAVAALGPYLAWPMTDSGSTAADASGNGRTGTYTGGITTGVTGSVPVNFINRAVSQTNSSSCLNTTSTTAVSGPSAYTEVIWFKAASGYNRGGKLIGFENPRTDVGAQGLSNYDRMLYLDGSGKVWLAVYNNGLLGLLGYVGVSSPGTFNDGAWHMAVGTLGPSGMALYVDGVLQGTNTNSVAMASTGWWRVGCGNLAGWGASWTGANNPDLNLVNLAYNAYFTGSLDEAAVFTGTALSASQVAALYAAR